MVRTMLSAATTAQFLCFAAAPRDRASNTRDPLKGQGQERLAIGFLARITQFLGELRPKLSTLFFIFEFGGRELTLDP